MNIQFMTKEANGIPTGEFDWKGEEKFVYVPNFDELVKNASCEDEIKAIRETEEIMKSGKSIYKGFAFEIVYMVYTKTFVMNLETKKYESVMEWQMMQHPWIRTFEGVYHTKEQMIEEIESMYQ